MSWLRRWDRGSRRAAGAVGVAAAVAVAAVATALHVTPPRATGGSPPAPSPLPSVADRSGGDGGRAVRTAVEADPFRPERSPPERRYVLPANRAGGDGDTRPARRGGLQLVGTATFADRPGIAALRLASGESRVLTSGNEVRGLRVTRVEEGRIVLSGPDTTLVLRVESPGERP